MICKECSFEQDLSLAFDQGEEVCERCGAVGEWKEEEKAVVMPKDADLLPATIAEMSAELFFVPGNMDEVITLLEARAGEFTPDLTTDKSRKAIASFSAKFSKSKTFLDGKGKDLVSGWKEKAKVIDTERKKFRDTCDRLRDEVRQPLTEWDEAAKKRVAAEQLALEVETAHGEAIAENDLFNRQKEVERKEQEMALAEEKRLAKEVEAKAEKERIAAEATAKKEQAAREEKIRLEAEQKAKDEAAQKIADAKAKIEQAKVDKIAAAKKAEEDKAEAVAEAKRQAAAQAKDLAEKAELERLAKETAERLEREAAEKKAANKKHRAKIDKEIITAIMSVGTIAEGQAKALVESIAKGDFTHISINY